MSEATDALILIVSEETGQVSMAKNGKIMHNMSFQEVRETINDYLNNEDLDSKFEDIEEYEIKKKRKQAMTSKS
jgi:diadenylate cyclase